MARVSSAADSIAPSRDHHNQDAPARLPGSQLQRRSPSCRKTACTNVLPNCSGLCFGLSFKATATETTLRYHERSYALPLIMTDILSAHLNTMFCTAKAAEYALEYCLQGRPGIPYCALHSMGSIGVLRTCPLDCATFGRAINNCTYRAKLKPSLRHSKLPSHKTCDCCCIVHSTDGASGVPSINRVQPCLPTTRLIFIRTPRVQPFFPRAAGRSPRDAHNSRRRGADSAFVPTSALFLSVPTV